MKKRVPFNVEAEIAKAFTFVWEEKQKTQKEGHDFNGQTYYVTATDLERRVRGAAAEQFDGLPEGKLGANYSNYHSGIRISTGGIPLLQLCRRYLLREARQEGRLQMHNFGRGHVSGERFRPVGFPLSPAEEKTFAKKEDREEKKAKGQIPVHAKDPSWRGYPSKTLCSAAARATERAKNRGYSGGRGRHRTSTKFEGRDFEGKEIPVTCPRCLKILAEARRAAEANVQPTPAAVSEE